MREYQRKWGYRPISLLLSEDMHQELVATCCDMWHLPDGPDDPPYSNRYRGMRVDVLAYSEQTGFVDVQ